MNKSRSRTASWQKAFDADAGQGRRRPDAGQRRRRTRAASEHRPARARPRPSRAGRVAHPSASSGAYQGRPARRERADRQPAEDRLRVLADDPAARRLPAWSRRARHRPGGDAGRAGPAVCWACGHGLRHGLPEHPAALVFLIIVFGLPDGRVPVQLLRPGRDLALALHRGLRLRGAALGHQRRPARPGGGGPGARHDVRSERCGDRAAAGVPRRSSRRWAACSSR